MVRYRYPDCKPILQIIQAKEFRDLKYRRIFEPFGFIGAVGDEARL